MTRDFLCIPNITLSNCWKANRLDNYKNLLYNELLLDAPIIVQQLFTNN